MDDQTETIIGLIGVVTILAVGTLGVYGFASGYLLESAGTLFVPTIATLAVAAVFVGALVGLGARSKRWRQNPYW
ncbi:hypothetical protein D8Y22_13220 [Salinadaptatus halalkaliphilus]|uniref:Major facilitator superfamily (MFS) profile domain-containing protein n=1 Tax=Salinadaptatus halalkaliphilus TaxID=2419781 RepID=A0A4S3TJU1_9EURY|nr:hypothetical protein [Salinadaptatus halalkaliphilus]THE64369.1 hypothetical protein D8Y22_13220 [Salinadaptatus halalkaliphilus]